MLPFHFIEDKAMNARELARAQRAEERELAKRRAYHTAIRVLALHASRKAIKEQLRARGLKISAFTARELAEWAELYFRANIAQLSHDAQRCVDAFPEFVRWRASAKLLTNAQTQNAQLAGTSVVQISCSNGGAQ
jgi:hypothetical protein